MKPQDIPPVKTDLIKFRHVFGADYIIGKRDQLVSDMEQFLRDALGVLVDVASDTQNPEKITLQLLPLPHKKADFKKANRILEAILSHEKKADPEKFEKMRQAAIRTFLAKWTARLKNKYKSEGEVIFDGQKRRGKEIRIEGFADIDLAAKNIDAVNINGWWGKESEALNYRQRFMPLAIKDLLEIAKYKGADIVERKAFQKAIRTRVGIGEVEVAKVEREPDFSEALIYLPATVREDAEKTWQDFNEESPTWGGFIKRMGSSAGVDITYIDAPDLRASLLKDEEVRQITIARLRERLQEFAQPLDPRLGEDEKKRLLKKIPGQRVKAMQMLERLARESREELQPKGEVVRFAQLPESLGDAPRYGAFHIKLRSHIAPNEESSELLSAAIASFSWFVGERNKQAGQQARSLAAYEAGMEAFKKRHGYVDAEAGAAKPDAQKRGPRYEKAKAIYDEAFKSFERRKPNMSKVARAAEQKKLNNLNPDSKTDQKKLRPTYEQEKAAHNKALKAFERRKAGMDEATQALERRKLEKMDPDRDRPTLKRVSFAGIPELMECYERELRAIRPRPFANDNRRRPVSLAPGQPQAGEAKLARHMQTALRVAAELTSSYIAYPADSQEILNLMRGPKDMWVSIINARYQTKLKFSQTADEFAQIYVPRDKAGIVALLDELQIRVRHRGTTLTPQDEAEIRELLEGSVMPQPIEKEIRDAAVEVGAPEDLACFTPPLPEEKLANLLGPGNANLKQISEHFSGIELHVRHGRVYAKEARVEALSNRDSGFRHRLLSVLHALHATAKKEEAITRQHVTNALSRSHDAIQAALRDLAYRELDIPGLTDSGVFDHVSLDAQPESPTHNTREFIYFTKDPGTSILAQIKGKNNYLLNKIKDAAGLTQIQVNSDSVILVSSKKKSGHEFDDGRGKLETARSYIVRYANLVAEKGYGSGTELDTALQVVLGKVPETSLPASKMPGSKPAAANEVSANIAASIIKDINAFMPEGNQIQASKLFESDYGAVCVVGPAGTGKTQLAFMRGLEAIRAGQFDRMMIVTPMATVGGKDIGFLPGDKNEKIGRWFQKYTHALSDILATTNSDGTRNHEAGGKILERLLGQKVIEREILEDMRGVNYERTIVILDEAQNSTPEQLKTAISRIRPNSKIWILGDPGQSDIGGLQGIKRKLMNTVKIDKGIITLRNRSQHFTLGAAETLGRFEKGGDTLFVTAHNGLSQSLLFHSAASAFAVCVFDRSDIHRHHIIGEILAIEEATYVAPEKIENLSGTGELDPDEILRIEAVRAQPKQPGGTLLPFKAPAHS